MGETPLWITGGERRLFGVLHRPDTPAPKRGGALLLAPFAEEKKGAHRLLVDLARALCRHGVTVLRFDYRGTGDSEGAFTDFTLAGALADTRVALDLLREQAAVTQVGLLGVRLGATLAAQAAPAVGATWLGVWEPVSSGRRYQQMILRQKRIREMMTAAEGAGAEEKASAHATASAAEGYDFDGYWITPRLQAELDALTFSAAAGQTPGRVLGVSVNAAGRVARDLETLGAAYRDAGAAVHLAAVAAEPFWNLQDPVPVPELVRVTTEWVIAGE